MLFPSPRPRQLFRAASTSLGERDAERSRSSLEAYERSRAANLALGCILVEAHHQTGDQAGAAIQRDFYRTLVQPARKQVDLVPEATDEATAAALVEAMGGQRFIPRRLVLAAGRVHRQPWSSHHGSRLHLERAFRYAAENSKAIASVKVARRLSSLVFELLVRGTGVRKLITENEFLEKCGESGLNAADAAVAWAEALGGELPPFLPLYFGDVAVNGTIRDVGDVRPGDVATLDIIQWLWPAFTAFAVTSLAEGDPAKVFSSENCASDLTFEAIIMQQTHLGYMINGVAWSAPLAVLDDLAFRREGETDDTPGQGRVAAAIASLVSPERVPTFAVGTEVEYGEGSSTTPRENPTTWATASVVEVNAPMAMATIRLAGEGNETKTVGLGALREEPGKLPCAATVVLAHAINDHRNDVTSSACAA